MISRNLRASLCVTLALCIGGQAETLKSDPPNDLFSLAQVSYAKAKETKDKKAALVEYKTAEKWLNKYLSKYSEHDRSAEGFYYLADCQTKLGNDPGALQSHVEVLKRTNKGALAGVSALKIGHAQYFAKEYHSGADYLSISNTELPDGKQKTYSYYLRGLCHKNLEQTDEFRSCLEYVLGKKDGKTHHSRCHLWLGQLELQAEQFESAYKHLKVCTNAPELEIRAEAVHKCALLAQKLGDTKAAQGYFSRVLSTPSLSHHHPTTALVLMNIAAEKKDLKQIANYAQYGAEGLTDIQKTQRLLWLAQSYSARGDQSKAQSYYTELATAAEGTATGFEVSYLQLANSKPKDLDIQSARRFLELYGTEFGNDPRYESMKLLVAEHYFQNEQLSEALAAYQALDLTKVDPENVPTIAYRLCKIATQSERPLDAIPYIDKFAHEYPDDARTPLLLFDKAGLYLKAENNEAALESYQSVLDHKLTPQDALRHSWETLAQLHAKAENYSKAIAAYEILTLKYTKGSTNEQKAEWHFWLAYSQFKTDSLTEAKQNLLKTKKFDPSYKNGEISRLLCLIAYTQDEVADLAREVARYDKLGLEPLPMHLYLKLALHECQEEDWDQAWSYFQQAYSQDPPPLSDTDPAILERYVRAASESQNYHAARTVAAHLKGLDLGAYRQANNLYYLGLAHYNLTGAAQAQEDVETAIRINPSGRLRYQLLLLGGKIEYDLDNNSKRLLKQVALLGAGDNKDLSREALDILIKGVERKTDADSQKELQEYRKELERLR